MALGEHPHQRDKILESVETSLKELKVSQTNIYYLHMPDRTTPLEETLEAINEAYKAGKFKKFGVSNFSPDEVEQTLQICKEKGYVKPTVYQGQYNAVVRGFEKGLFPILRENGIAFYAYRYEHSHAVQLDDSAKQLCGADELTSVARLRVDSLQEITREPILDLTEV